MLCNRCSAWSEVVETRKADRGFTIKRTRLCGNNHRFHTFEVLPPIYRRDPPTVRQTVVAAQVRGMLWKRNDEIVRSLSTMTHAEAAKVHGLSRAAITRINRNHK